MPIKTMSVYYIKLIVFNTKIILSLFAKYVIVEIALLEIQIFKKTLSTINLLFR